MMKPFGKEDLAVKALHSPAETESKVCFFSCNMKRRTIHSLLKKQQKSIFTSVLQRSLNKLKRSFVRDAVKSQEV